MAWITQNDIEIAISEEDLIYLTDDTGTGVVNTTTVASIITSQVGYLKARLKHRYPTQCTGETASATVKECLIVLCAIAIFGRRASFGVPGIWMKRYESCDILINQIAKGTRQVPEWTEDDITEIADHQYQTVDLDLVAWQDNRTEFEL